MGAKHSPDSDFLNLFFSGIFGMSDFFPNFAGNFVKIVISKLQLDCQISNKESLLSNAPNPNPNSEFTFGFDFQWNDSFAQFPVACATIFFENAFSFQDKNSRIIS